MKKFLSITLFAICAISTVATAGNKDRSGQAAASELLVNPWAATGGVFGMNGSYVSGLEAMKLNIGGLARTKSLELGAVYNSYIQNSGIGIVNAGFANRLSKKNVLGVNVMSINYGNIPVTGVDNPQGTGANFKPSFFNASIGYGHNFTEHIDGGLNVTFVSEGVSNVRASAVGIDAGIMYTTGDDDELHFGVTLRNVGSNMRFRGDGLSFNGTTPDNLDNQITVEQRSDKFQLPTQLNISVGYDLFFGQQRAIAAAKPVEGEITPEAAALTNTGMAYDSKLTLMGSFISNAFISDNVGAGLEYSFKNKLFLRGGYRYETRINDAALTSTFYRGLSAGAGVALKFGKEESNSRLQIDYAFKPTRVGAVHGVSLRFFK
jgi:opacity protein-like surface antigen